MFVRVIGISLHIDHTLDGQALILHETCIFRGVRFSYMNHSYISPKCNTTFETVSTYWMTNENASIKQWQRCCCHRPISYFHKGICSVLPKCKFCSIFIMWRFSGSLPTDARTIFLHIFALLVPAIQITSLCHCLSPLASDIKVGEHLQRNHRIPLQFLITI